MHNPTRKLIQRAAGDLQGQLAFAHPAHAGEKHPAARWADQLKERGALQVAPHKAAGVGVAVGEVVGGVGLGELGVGFGGRIMMHMLVARDAFDRAPWPRRDHSLISADADRTGVGDALGGP